MYFESSDTLPLVNKIKQISKTLRKRGFFVKSSKGPYDFTAVHRTGDLIISLYYIGAHTIKRTELTTSNNKTTEDDITMTGFKINYYPSMRYIEDNILSRLFGIVKDDGVVSAGIRSLNIPKNVDYENSIDPFKSNKMLTHKLLVPKNFRQVLINTEAMSSILQRSGTGQFKSEGKITDKQGLFVQLP